MLGCSVAPRPLATAVARLARPGQALSSLLPCSRQGWRFRVAGRKGLRGGAHDRKRLQLAEPSAPRRCAWGADVLPCSFAARRHSIATVEAAKTEEASKPAARLAATSSGASLGVAEALSSMSGCPNKTTGRVHPWDSAKSSCRLSPVLLVAPAEHLRLIPALRRVSRLADLGSTLGRVQCPRWLVAP